MSYEDRSPEEARINKMLKREGVKINSHLHHLEEQLSTLARQVEVLKDRQEHYATNSMHLAFGMGLQTFKLSLIEDFFKNKYPEDWVEIEQTLKEVTDKYGPK